jgi:hypothetical protein
LELGEGDAEFRLDCGTGVAGANANPLDDENEKQLEDTHTTV